ncbi:hypothetical protein [Nonomuraea sp. NPDC049400]|uniref:hypothetical protein n=1 Tax=Nonomuraea sp. NPDC049400 TaxID=3364352 RepID=UPI0037B8C30F
MKKNAVELARKERAMPEGKRQGTILLSSVTDPYQGQGTKYRLTRGILPELDAVAYPGLVRILTKSLVVTRDIDLLTNLPRAEVGMTITTTDDKVTRWLEVRAPLASPPAYPRRTQRRRHPHLRLRRPAPAPLRHPVRIPGPSLRAARQGRRHRGVQGHNLKRYIRERMNQFLADEPEEVREAYSRPAPRNTAGSST